MLLLTYMQKVLLAGKFSSPKLTIHCRKCIFMIKMVTHATLKAVTKPNSAIKTVTVAILICMLKSLHIEEHVAADKVQVGVQYFYRELNKHLVTHVTFLLDFVILPHSILFSPI
jgi:hypothetical protein